MYAHKKVTTTFHFESGLRLIRLAMPASLPSTLEPFIACSFLPFSSLFDCQTTQAGLAAPKLPQPGVNLVDIVPRLPSAAAESAQPYGKRKSLRLINMRGIVGVELPARNRGIRDPAHHVLSHSHVETQCWGPWGWFL